MTPLLSFKGEALLRVQKYVFYMMSRMNFVVTTCTDTQSEELWEMSGLQQLEFGLEERGITMKIRRLCCFHCSICSKVYGVCRYMYVAIPSFFYFHWRNLPYVHESESIDEYDKAIWFNYLPAAEEYLIASFNQGYDSVMSYSTSQRSSQERGFQEPLSYPKGIFCCVWSVSSLTNFVSSLCKSSLSKEKCNAEAWHTASCQRKWRKPSSFEGMDNGVRSLNIDVEFGTRVLNFR